MEDAIRRPEVITPHYKKYKKYMFSSFKWHQKNALYLFILTPET